MNDVKQLQLFSSSADHEGYEETAISISGASQAFIRPRIEPKISYGCSDDATYLENGGTTVDITRGLEKSSL